MARISNTGLATTFYLKNGKFVLSSGEAKAEDNLSMLFIFSNWFRIFSSDYILNTLRFHQRVTTYVLKHKNVFRVKIMNSINKYCLGVKAYSVDLNRAKNNNKAYYIDVQYTYSLGSDGGSTKIIRFI